MKFRSSNYLPPSSSTHGWSGAGDKWISYVRTKPGTPVEVKGRFESEAEAEADAYRLDAETNASVTALRSAWIAEHARLDLSDVDLGEFMVPSADLDTDEYAYEADEVFDGVSLETLSRRSTPMLNRDERTKRDARPVSEPMSYSPAAMPDMLDFALANGVADRDRDRERELVAEVQDGASSVAFLELVSMYSNHINDAINNGVKTHGARADVDSLKRAALIAFTEHVMKFDLSRGPEASLYGGPGVTPIAYIFAPAVRQAVADETLPVTVNGRTVSEALAPAKAAKTERMRAEDVKRVPNIGVLLDEMGDTVWLAGFEFTRSQVELASEIAHMERVAYARFGRIETGSVYDWAFGDLPNDTHITAMLNRATFIEDVEGEEVPRGFASLSLLDIDPAADARMTTRVQRDRIERMMSVLTERQRETVEALFGLGGMEPMTQSEYAAATGVDQSTVSRTLNHALDAMLAYEGPA